MKILFIITSLGMGGAENILASLSDSLVKKGHEIKIICLTGQILVKPNSKNIEIISLNLNGFTNIFYVIKNIVENIRDFKPDIVHAHMFHAIILARLAKIFVSIPKLISNAHNKPYGNWLRGFSYKITDRLSDVNVNVSEEATRNFIANRIFTEKKTITVLNGIDTEKFKSDLNIRNNTRQLFGIDDHEKIFINVASLTEQKDFANLLKSYKIFLETTRNSSRLYIVGDGILRQEIEVLIKSYDLENNVELLGIRTDVPDLLNMADVFVLSSAWEGFGLVVAEAMATEKIVIATDCGGVKEVLGNEKFLVPTKNSQALAQKMLDAENLNEQEILEMGRQNRQKIVQQYSSNAMVDHWLEVYNR